MRPFMKCFPAALCYLLIGATVAAKAGTRGTVYTKKSEVEPFGTVLIQDWHSNEGGWCSEPIDARGYTSIAVSMGGKVYSPGVCTVSVSARVSEDDGFETVPGLTWTYSAMAVGSRGFSAYEVNPGSLLAAEIQVCIRQSNGRYTQQGRMSVYLE